MMAITIILRILSANALSLIGLSELLVGVSIVGSIYYSKFYLYFHG